MVRGRRASCGRAGSSAFRCCTTRSRSCAAAAGKSAAGPDKFATLKIAAVEPAAGLDAPGVAGSVAILWCRVKERIETGDHLLFIGEVVAHHVDERRIEPLLRYRRRYMRSGHWTSEESPEGYPT